MLTNQQGKYRAFKPALLAAALCATPAAAQGVLDRWGPIAPPGEKPVAQPVRLDPATTALLVLDLAQQTCPPERHCPDMLPQSAALLAHARARDWTVIYTLGAASQNADILPDIAPRPGEPIMKGPPDKFIGTALEQTLKEHGIRTVVTLGSAAEGAVLETAASAAFRGFDVVLPADGLASSSDYARQYVIWDLTHAPAVSPRLRLSATTLIE